MTPDFSLNLQKLTIAKYLFRLRAETPILLPPYKGSSFHGGFGHALKRIAPFYYKEIFEPGSDGAKPKPFVLLPPLDTEKQYPAGHNFTCELTLFGSAEQFFPICHAALEFLGRELGIGSNRGKFTVQSMETAQPFRQDQSRDSDKGVNCLDIATACGNSAVRDSLTIYLPTRLRLKADGRLVSGAPDFHLFFARLLGRINTLSSLYGNGKAVQAEGRDLLIKLAAETIALDRQTTDNSCVWKDLPRYSGRQKQWMKFGGLTGAISWQGKEDDFQPFLPFLAVGEWIHAGGKTSFGLGKYVMERKNND